MFGRAGNNNNNNNASFFFVDELPRYSTVWSKQPKGQRGEVIVMVEEQAVDNKKKEMRKLAVLSLAGSDVGRMARPL